MTMQDPVTYDLWVAGSGGYHTYRIPALVATASGSILAFCEGRRDSSHDTGDIDLLLRRSTDGGASWERSRVIVTEPAMTCGNPAPVLDRATGIIWLPFCKNRADGDESAIRQGVAPRTVWVTHSKDDGLSWSLPVEITIDVKRPTWTWYATGPCHGVQMPSGRLVIPCDYRERDPATGAEGRFSHVIYSDDHGGTWRIGGIVNMEGTNESVAVALADGRLYLNCRDQARRGHRISAWSDDGGETFGPPYAEATLIEPACQASAILVEAGQSLGEDTLVFANPASATRDTLTLRLGAADASSWSSGRVLEPGRAAYCDLAISPKRPHGGPPTLLCLFETGVVTPYEVLRLARVPFDWLS